MTIVRIQEKWEIKDIRQFVKEFKLQKEFKQKYGYSVEDWDYDISEEECIEELLGDLDNNYLLIFIETYIAEGYFLIYKL